MTVDKPERNLILKGLVCAVKWVNMAESGKIEGVPALKIEHLRKVYAPNSAARKAGEARIGVHGGAQ